MTKYLSVIIITALALLITINSYSRNTCDQKPKNNGLCQLTLDAGNNKKQIIGKEYVFECCDDDFTLTQFVEPNLLLLTWIPEGKHCWQYQKILSGRRLLLQINDKAFQEMRRERGLIGNFTLGEVDKIEWGETWFSVVGVNEITMSDGTIMNVAIIKMVK
jgi:hypothetical protein